MMVTFNTGVGALLGADVLAHIEVRAARARRAVLTATTVAGSGHPGGSFSSMEILALLYGTARLRPQEPSWEDRDRIVVSHGHVSPGVYANLALAGFFAVEEVEAHFRQSGSVFEGHVERSVPGIEWSTGNLGQGLSAGVGFALAARATGSSWHTFVAMSDGEQHKGQVAEARRVAVKEGLGSLTAVVDWNRVQISGHTDEVMPVPVREDWAADGWRVYECDGHDLRELAEAIRSAHDDGVPSVVLARTVIGRGVSFMEDDPQFHGRALTREEYIRAMAELGGSEDDLGAAVVRRAQPCAVAPRHMEVLPPFLAAGIPRTYSADKPTDNRSAWGTALADLAVANPESPMLVFDCDLAVSVKTDAFAAVRPQGFVQCGVGEHNAATASGAASVVPGVVAFWADFGVFCIDEAYNQQRLNAINAASLKLVATHCGLDVGEDGKTHQCIDYVGAFRSMFGWKVVVPADPNQTDRAVRAMAVVPENVCIAMGRSKLSALTLTNGAAAFGDDYEFEYGRIDVIREGVDAFVLAMGTLAGAAVAAVDALRNEGMSVGVGIVSCPLDLDDSAMRRACAARCVVTVEDHKPATGLGGSVAQWMANNVTCTRLITLGVDSFSSSGSAADLFAAARLDASSIAESLRRTLNPA